MALYSLNTEAASFIYAYVTQIFILQCREINSKPKEHKAIMSAKCICN